MGCEKASVWFFEESQRVVGTRESQTRRAHGEIRRCDLPAAPLQKKTEKTSKADVELAAKRYRELSKELGQ